MKDGHPGARLVANAEWQAFATGQDIRQKSGMVARLLEDDAVRNGWPEGRCVGNESELIARFAVNREVLREAIRVLAARGAVVMKRGSHGGLYLCRPSLETCAYSFATYLRARGCSHAQLAETVAVADPLFQELPEDYLVSRLFRQTLAAFADEAVESQADLRGAAIAMRLIGRGAPIAPRGLFLGSEADLCTELNASRSVFRQALRILDDLGMLRVRRGRGGGYLLQRPAAIGMSRRLFVLFASQQLTVQDVIPGIWTLNLVNLRLTALRLGSLQPALRQKRCDELAAVLSQAVEPHRWALLMQELDRSADNMLAGTLLSCLIAFLARSGLPAPSYSSVEEDLRELEERLVAALRSNDTGGAERHHRKAQSCLARMLGCDDPPASTFGFQRGTRKLAGSSSATGPSPRGVPSGTHE